MGLRIKDRLELFIYFGDKEFPLAPTNAVDFLHLSCSSRLAVPMLHMKLKDSAKWLAKEQVLVDGAIIKIILKIKDEKQEYQFRLNAFKEQLDTVPTYEIDGYFDAITWWLASTADMLRGTSSDVIGTIAKRCRFPYYFTNKTSDPQVWIQRNMRFHEFANMIASHGYVDDKSCMQLGLDLNGSLIYRNITAKIPSAATFTTAKYNSSSLIATDFKIKNRSGLLNTISGYADETYAPSIMKGNPDRFSTIPVTKLTQKLMVNADVYNSVEKSRVLFAPVDGGNVHQNYVKAKYQNERIASTYAFGVDLVTPQISGVKLLDFIEFISNQPGEKEDKPYSGTYVVTGHVIYIQGINYYEKIEAVRHGLNAAVSSQL